jgi:hypothetical protein
MAHPLVSRMEILSEIPAGGRTGKDYRPLPAMISQKVY